MSEGVVQFTKERRIFDWRFLAALALMALVAFAIWNGFHAARERDLVTAQNGELISQNSQLVSRIDAQQRQQDADTAEASKERATLLAQMSVLIQRYDQLYADQKALLQYLRAHGIRIPTRFVTVPQRVIVTAPPTVSPPATPPTKPVKPPKAKNKK